MHENSNSRVVIVSSIPYMAKDENNFFFYPLHANCQNGKGNFLCGEIKLKVEYRTEDFFEDSASEVGFISTSIKTLLPLSKKTQHTLHAHHTHLHLSPKKSRYRMKIKNQQLLPPFQLFLLNPRAF
jgi:hypothetical protein